MKTDKNGQLKFLDRTCLGLDKIEGLSMHLIVPNNLCLRNHNYAESVTANLQFKMTGSL